MQTFETIFIHPSIHGNHYKHHFCQGVCTRIGDLYEIELMNTKTWFDRHRIIPSPGDQLTAAESNRHFTITDVSFRYERPRYAIVSATLNP